MTLKNLLKWYFSTLLIGAGVTFVVGFVAELFVGNPLFGPVDQLLLTGFVFASITQLGFFSYLIFNWLSIGLIRNQQTFAIIQIIFLVLVFGNVVYLNVSKYTGTDLVLHLLIPVSLLAVSVVIGKQKARWTQKAAFIPTLFFMFTVTMLEAIPSMNIKGGEAPIYTIALTVFVLTLCNAWQILNLHHWTRSTKNIKANTETPISESKTSKKKS